ncbi:MAG: DMT family transporter [Patescibacteria group bacterium]
MAALGISFALGSALIFTLYSLLSRVTAVKSDEPMTIAILHDFFATVISLMAFIVIRPAFPGKLSVWVWIAVILSCIGYTIFSATKFFGHKYIEVSYRTQLTQIAPIATFIGSALILHEEITLRRLIAVVLIVGGNMIALYKHDGKVSLQGIRIVLLGAVAIGLSYVADKFASPSFPLSLYMLITYGIPGILIFLIFRFQRKDALGLIKRELVLRTWKIPFLAFLSVAGYFLFLKAFALVDASVASPALYSSTILTSLGGIIFLRERSNLRRRIFGAVVVFLGIVLLK